MKNSVTTYSAAYWSCVVSLFVISISSCQDLRTENSLPTVHLFYDESTLGYDEKQEAEARFRIDNLGHSDLTKMKLRGGWSRLYPKKSYTLNLEADPIVSFLEEDNDYILSASYIDKTMLRHVFSFELFKKLTQDSTSAPKSTYVDLFVNRKYNGLYLLHPRVDRSYLDLKKSGSLFKDPPLFFKKDPPPFEDIENRYQQKYPDVDKTDVNDQLDAIRRKYMNRSLCDSDVFETFDLNHILNWHILLLLTHGSDGLLKNFYLFKTSEHAPFKICIWDYDHSFGRDGDNELNRDTTVLDISRNWLISQLMECPNYLKQLVETYEDHRIRGPLKTDVLLYSLDSLYSKYRADIYRNGERWPWDSKNYFDENNADQEVELMRNYIEKKLLKLDDYFKAII